MRLVARVEHSAARCGAMQGDSAVSDTDDLVVLAVGCAPELVRFNVFPELAGTPLHDRTVATERFERSSSCWRTASEGACQLTLNARFGQGMIRGSREPSAKLLLFTNTRARPGAGTGRGPLCGIAGCRARR